MKKITRKHKDALKWAGLNPNNWLVKKQVDKQLVIRHKLTGKERKIPS